jgi:hypothetical protein
MWFGRGDPAISVFSLKSTGSSETLGPIIKLHGITFQVAFIFIAITLRVSDLTSLKQLHRKFWFQCLGPTLPVSLALGLLPVHLYKQRLH